VNIVAEAIARVPATCGELLQGVDSAGPLLVSLPIALCGTVEVALTREPVVSVTPSLPRAMAALRLALDRVGWRGGAVARLGGEVPLAHGMGSSTVDIAGIIGATAAAAGLTLPPHDLLSLITAVEPSDSSPLPGLWAIDHVFGTRALQIGARPPVWHLVAVESGTPHDTLAVHRDHGPGPRMPDSTSFCLATADPLTLARIATESATRNQQRLPHPAFATMQTVVSATSALGLCVAHSGSVCAVICDGVDSAATTATALRAYGLASTTWRATAPGMRVEVRTPVL
jgi:L-threonine kinase